MQHKLCINQGHHHIPARDSVLPDLPPH